MNTYEQIREIYYDTFPEEKKLEFGCEIIYKHSKEPLILVDGFDNPNIHAILKNDHLYNSWGVSQDDIVEILGKDIDIRELLQLLNKKPINAYPINTRITEQGCIECSDGIEYKKVATLDLSKPLKDQPEKELKKILEVIKKIDYD